MKKILAKIGITIGFTLAWLVLFPFVALIALINALIDPFFWYDYGLQDIWEDER